RGSALDGQGADHDESMLHDVTPGRGSHALHFNDYRPFLSVGGPIRRDKAWYFLTAEYVQEEEPMNAVSRSFIKTTREKRVFGKVTWDLSASQKLTFTTTVDPQEYGNLGIDSFTPQESGYSQRQGGRNLVLKDTSIFSPNVFLESTVQWFASVPSLVPNMDPDTNGNGRFSFDR